MADKKHITITIDREVYFKLQLSTDKNISGLVNNFLISYLDNNKDSKVKRDIKKLEKKKNKIEEEIAILKFQVKENGKKQTKEEKKTEEKELEESSALLKGVKKAGLLNQQ